MIIFQFSSEDLEEMEAKLERALKEIGQLKVDREVAVEKREKQVCAVRFENCAFSPSIPVFY